MGNLILIDFWSEFYIKQHHIFQKKGGVHSPTLLLWILPCRPYYYNRPIKGLKGSMQHYTVLMALNGQPPNLHFITGITSLVIYVWRGKLLHGLLTLF